MAENTKPSRCVDASFVLAFLLPDERVQEVARAFEEFAAGACSLYSSPLLPFEVFNGLRMAVLRKRVKAAQAVELGKTFLTWDIHCESVPFISIAELALKERVTVYDASYAWLARHKNIPLLTLDQELARVAK